jgi:hypothetical protein
MRDPETLLRKADRVKGLEFSPVEAKKIVKRPSPGPVPEFGMNADKFGPRVVADDPFRNICHSKDPLGC